MDKIEETRPSPNGSQGPVSTADDEKPEPELPSEDAQQGVHDVEAVTLSWSRGTLIAVFLKYVSSAAAPSWQRHARDSKLMYRSLYIAASGVST